MNPIAKNTAPANDSTHIADIDAADIIVVGGGLVGFATALSMAQAGASVTLLDRGHSGGGGKTTKPDSIRTTTINPASFQQLMALGAVEAMAEDQRPLTPMRQIKVSDAQSQSRPRFAKSDHLITWEESSSDAPLGYVFRNQDMVTVLSKLAQAHPLITIRDGVTVTDFTARHPQLGDAAAAVYLDNQDNEPQILAARLVVAADGRNSPIRKAAALRAITRKPGQTAIVADIRTSKPHQHLAWQRFLDGGPAALMPLDDDRLMALVWTLRDDDARVLMAADDASFQQSLMEHFGDGFGTLTLASERKTWPLELSHVLRPTASRLVLVGDAAHTIHPLAGQGYNLGLGDAKALGQLVKEARQEGRDYGDRLGLQQYRRRRLAETASMTLATDGLNSVFSFGHPLAKAVTGMGMALLNASPLKKLAMTAASGGLSQNPLRPAQSLLKKKS